MHWAFSTEPVKYKLIPIKYSMKLFNYYKSVIEMDIYKAISKIFMLQFHEKTILYASKSVFSWGRLM